LSATAFDQRSDTAAALNLLRIEVAIRDKESARYFIAWVYKFDALTNKAAGWRTQAEKDHVIGQIGEARRIYQRLSE
jgi:hypothetical protein